LKTIIFYNGGEFVAHESIAHALDGNIYFAKSYHFWQNGPNENSKSLLWRFSLKGMKIVG
jgi:IS30 family transposase